MDDVTKKRVFIGASIGCFVLAGIIFMATTRSGSGGGGGGNHTQYLLCKNQGCGAVTEMSDDEFRKQIQGTEIETGPMVLECPKCHQKSAYPATKCEKCGAVFITGTQTLGSYPDKCPECGYSKYEEN